MCAHCMCVCIHTCHGLVCIHTCHNLCGAQKATLKNRFSSSAFMWGLGIEFRSWGLCCKHLYLLRHLVDPLKIFYKWFCLVCRKAAVWLRVSCWLLFWASLPVLSFVDSPLLRKPGRNTSHSTFLVTYFPNVLYGPQIPGQNWKIVVSWWPFSPEFRRREVLTGAHELPSKYSRVA